MGWRWVLPFLFLEGRTVSEALIKPKQVMFYLNNFSIFKKNRTFCFLSRWFLCLSPCLKHKGFFSDVHCENLVNTHEVKLTEEGETLWWLGSSGVLTIRIVYTEPPEIWRLQLDFPSWTVLPTKMALLAVILDIRLLVSPVLSVGICSWPQLSDRSKNYLFFSFFTLLLVKME